MKKGKIGVVLMEILKGWGNLLIEKMGIYRTELQKLAAKRRKICNSCPIRFGKICSKEKGGCGCVIEAKILCETCKCPKDLW